MRLARWFGLAGAAVLSASACGDGPLTAKATVGDLAELVCESAFRCCSRGEIDVFLGPFVDEANCADRLRRKAELNPSALIGVPFGLAGVLVPNISVLQRAIDEDRAVINETALTECLNFIDAIACNMFEEVVVEPEGCQPAAPKVLVPCDPSLIVVGKVSAGGACSSPGESLECKPGLTCTAVDSLGVEGVCIRPGKVGDFCTVSRDCELALYCSLLDGTCQVPRAEGETCKYSDENDLSPSDSTLLIACAEDLSCDPVSDTCVARCERGARCIGDGDCDDAQGLTCISGRCDSTRGDGLPCGNDDDCEDGLRCAISPMTGTDLVCQAKLVNGQSCSTFDPEDCESGFCHPSSLLCEAASAPGSLCPTALQNQCDGGYCDTTFISCSDSTPCLGSGVCNTSSFRCEYYCVALQPDGAGCTSSIQCESGTCIDGFCRTVPLANGQPCNFNFQCSSSFCNFESPRVCETLPLINGRTCSSSSQCQSGVCFQNSCQNGLTEGADCTSFFDPPCGRGLYCDRTQNPALCVPLLEPGQLCDSSAQCRGSCIIRFNRPMCDATPPHGAVVCDGM
jgi:hypothetical protein